MRRTLTAFRKRLQPGAALRRVWQMAGLLIAWLAVGAAASAQQPPNALDVQAERRGGLIDVRARAMLRAPMPVVWQTLTDYERLPEFIPGLASSRITARKVDNTLRAPSHLVHHRQQHVGTDAAARRRRACAWNARRSYSRW